MGQYFVLINKTKKQYVCPWCLGGVAKLWEWCAGNHSAVFPYLLRRSSGLGGGDVASPEIYPLAGSWVGDEISLVGDYDESHDFDTAFSNYENISVALGEEFNRFINYEDLLLEVRLCSGCSGVELDTLDEITV